MNETLSRIDQRKRGIKGTAAKEKVKKERTVVWKDLEVKYSIDIKVCIAFLLDH